MNRIKYPAKIPRLFIARPSLGLSQDVFANLIAPELQSRSIEPVQIPHGYSLDVVGDVIAAIESCDGVLAVLAGRNRNVFVEVGIAIAKRKPIILLVETPSDAGMLDNPVISIDEPEELRCALDTLLEHILAGAAR